jgi:hypothetical protein
MTAGRFAKWSNEQEQKKKKNLVHGLDRSNFILQDSNGKSLTRLMEMWIIWLLCGRHKSAPHLVFGFHVFFNLSQQNPGAVTSSPV